MHFVFIVFQICSKYEPFSLPKVMQQHIQGAVGTIIWSLLQMQKRIFNIG